MVIHMEIAQSLWKKGAWNIRVGTIEGGSESSNITKKELLEEIKEQLKIEELNQKKEK